MPRPRQLSDDDISVIRALAARGEAQTTIALATGHSRATVARYAMTPASLTAIRPSDGRPAPEPAWEPACMDEAELADWREGTIAGCRDCTTEYAEQMRARGRCNGIPGQLIAGVVADEDEDEPMEPAEKPAAVQGILVEAELPCGTCAHAPICSIRPKTASLPVIPPKLARGLHATIRLRVDCDHYMKVSHGRKAAISDDAVLAAFDEAGGNGVKAAAALGYASSGSLRDRRARILARRGQAPG